MNERPGRRVLNALVLGAALSTGACTSSSHSSSGTTPRPSAAPTTATAAAWASIDHALAGLGPDVGFLAARVNEQGTCRALHEIAPAAPRPTGSQFKLFVLGALADQIETTRVSWAETVTVQDSMKSAGNGAGSLQYATAGTAVPVEAVATKMISISDNTAADMLIALVGRNNVEAQVGRWSSHAAANQPFLTTREMLLLHYVPGLADRYIATPASGRAAFLAAAVDTRPLGDIALGFSQDPRYVDTVEWFASPDDICRAFAGLQQLAKQPSLSRALPTVLSRELGTIGLDRSAWPTIWFKGGSEPGVLTLGWLATNRRGESFVVEAMVSNPDAALATDSITDLVALARRSFGLLE